MIVSDGGGSTECLWGNGNFTEDLQFKYLPRNDMSQRDKKEVARKRVMERVLGTARKACAKARRQEGAPGREQYSWQGSQEQGDCAQGLGMQRRSPGFTLSPTRSREGYDPSDVFVVRIN